MFIVQSEEFIVSVFRVFRCSLRRLGVFDGDFMLFAGIGEEETDEVMNGFGRAVDDLARLLSAEQNATSRVALPIACMNADALKARHVEQQGQQAVEPSALREHQRVGSCWDGGTQILILLLADGWFQRVTIKLPVNV